MADHSQNVRPELAKNSLDVDFSHSAGESTLTEAALTKTVDLDASDPELDIDIEVSSTVCALDSELENSGFSSEFKNNCPDIELNSNGVSADTSIEVADQYASLVAPIECTEEMDGAAPVEVGETQTFHSRPISGNNKTILDRLVTYIAMALKKLDDFLSGRGRTMLERRRKLRSERESELEEFMNERTKNAIGKKLGAKNKRKQESEDLEEDFQN